MSQSAASPAKTYRAGKTKARHIFVIAGVMAVVALALIFVVEPDERVANPQGIGWLVLALAVVVAGKGLWDGRGGEEVLRLGPSGLWFRYWDAEVPWAEIAGIETRGQRIRPLIAIVLTDFDSFAAKAKIKPGPFAKAPALFIPHGLVEGDFADLVATMRIAKEAWG